MRVLSLVISFLLIANLLACKPQQDDFIKTVEFKLTIDDPISSDDYISIGSNLNDWDPSNQSYALTKLTPTTYQLILDIDVSKGNQTIEYKYTIQSFTNDNPWSKVEKGANNEEIPNRKLIITKESLKRTVVLDTVAMFNSATDKSTVVGHLDVFKLKMTSLDKERTIRVWMPSSYDKKGSRKYPVLYLQDGQNLFDQYTSFSGEWGIDESIESLIETLKIDGFIVVGIDNGGVLRMDEYTPNWIDHEDKLGGLYGEFIVHTLKPFIDDKYLTLKEKEHTLIGGSSMGGLISFYIGLKYSNTFGSIMAMSSSFQINTPEARQHFIRSLDLSVAPKLYLDSGYPGDNSEFIDTVKQELINQGYDESLIYTKKTEGHKHNESAWRARFPEAIKWIFNL